MGLDATNKPGDVGEPPQNSKLIFVIAKLMLDSAQQQKKEIDYERLYYISKVLKKNESVKYLNHNTIIDRVDQLLSK